MRLILILLAAKGNGLVVYICRKLLKLIFATAIWIVCRVIDLCTQWKLLFRYSWKSLVFIETLFVALRERVQVWSTLSVYNLITNASKVKVVVEIMFRLSRDLLKAFHSFDFIEFPDVGMIWRASKGFEKFMIQPFGI